MAEIETGPATAADLPRLVSLIEALAAHHDDSAVTDTATLSRDILGETPWVTMIVARVAGDIVGYAALCPLVQLQFGVRGMDMHHLYVVPPHRGTGVGQALVKASQNAAASLGCRYLAVGTHPDNDAAQRFYERAGFDRLPGGPRFRIKLAAG